MTSCTVKEKKVKLRKNLCSEEIQKTKSFLAHSFPPLKRKIYWGLIPHNHSKYFSIKIPLAYLREKFLWGWPGRDEGYGRSEGGGMKGTEEGRKSTGQKKNHERWRRKGKRKKKVKCKWRKEQKNEVPRKPIGEK